MKDSFEPVLAIDTYLDGELNAHETESLRQWFDEHPEGADLLAERAFIHSRLSMIYAYAEDSTHPVLNDHEEASGDALPKIEVKPASLLRRIKRFDSIHPQRHRFRFSTFSAVLTALAWIGFSYFVWFSTAPNDFRPRRDEINVNFVARITGQYEHRWAESTRGIPWHAFLVPGEKLNLVEGLIEITFYDGAKVVLEAPAEFIVDSRGAGTLEVGKLTARAHNGFLIATANANFVDLGTEFGVSVDKLGVAELHVFDGMVRAEMIDATGRVLGAVTLQEDEAIQIDARRTQIATITAKPDAFALVVDNWPGAIHSGGPAVFFSNFEYHSELIFETDASSLNGARNQVGSFSGLIPHPVSAVSLLSYEDNGDNHLLLIDEPTADGAFTAYLSSTIALDGASVSFNVQTRRATGNRSKDYDIIGFDDSGNESFHLRVNTSNTARVGERLSVVTEAGTIVIDELISAYGGRGLDRSEDIPQSMILYQQSMARVALRLSSDGYQICFVGNDNVYQTRSVPYNGAAAELSRIEFQFSGKDGSRSGFYLDNLRVEAAVLPETTE